MTALAQALTLAATQRVVPFLALVAVGQEALQPQALAQSLEQAVTAFHGSTACSMVQEEAAARPASARFLLQVLVALAAAEPAAHTR